MEGRWYFLVRQRGLRWLLFFLLNPQAHLLYLLNMRYLLTALLLLPVLLSAQELHTFRNGEVADADKLNESLQYILNNASGGCSVEQVDNTAEITWADGTTAVVPGYGTVVVYGNGTVGELPPVDYNTGSIVLKDNANVVLGEVKSNRENCFDLMLNES